MKFDKLIFHGTNRSGRHIHVTVDFEIGEITAQSAPGGEVMWCRLAGHRGTVFHAKLDACDFGTWEDSGTWRERSLSSTDGIAAGSSSPDGWSLDLCREGRPVKHLSGDGDATKQSCAFVSLIDLCLSFAENRSAGQRVPISPELAF